MVFEETIESFRSLDESDYEYEIFLIEQVRARKPASFWREKRDTVVISFGSSFCKNVLLKQGISFGIFRSEKRLRYQQ